MTEDDIRIKFGEELGGPLSDEEWEVIVGRGYCREIMEDFSTIPNIARELREASEDYFKFAHRFIRGPLSPLSRREQPGKKPKLEPGETSVRSKVLSIIYAYDASQDEEVQRFRESVLNCLIIKPSKVETWIKEWAKIDGIPSYWLRDVPVPMDLWKRWMVSAEKKYAVEITKDFLKTQKVELHHALEYAVPDDDWVRRISTTTGGVLEELRRLSEKLASRYGWQPALATVFVLTGHIPEVATIISKIQSHFIKTNTLKLASKELRVPAIPKICLTIDPSATPEEVGDYYRKVRRKILGNRRYKKLSDKHLYLALLKAGLPKGESCASQMSRWNKGHPNWRYEHYSNFVRDCRRSLHRLLMREYIVPE